MLEKPLSSWAQMIEELDLLEDQFVKVIHQKKMDQFWSSLVDLLCIYFRLEVHGIQNIPKGQPFILISNHSGYLGLDAVILSHIVHKNCGHIPHILAHWSYFELSTLVNKVAKSFGLRQAKSKEAYKDLLNKEALIIFPEGEAGNFKSTFRRYQLQEFHTGFLRLAAKAQVPIIPCSVLGAEEAHINIGNIDLSKLKKNFRIPLPMNFLPFPSRWRITFYKALDLDYDKIGQDFEELSACCEQIRLDLQKKIKFETRKRRKIFF